MRDKKHREALRQRTHQQSETDTTQTPRKPTRKKAGGCGCGKKKK
ncbi:hypothetical protein HFA01_19090 [Halobacillus faecis]|uniref:Uncharacterized protein n=1 Tax=Halobacillus faecis TaxID=360184 RepID=A0A511WRL8_9BACI|nr:hypothetical protein HFA01_19090 [Halobacillus faecis]